MKLQQLDIEGFLGIARARIEFPAPVKLVCGPNGAGKSSVAEALRFALLGESARVRLKKDYPQLVHGGARRARVAAVVDGIEHAREVRTGKLEAEAPAVPEALAFALDPPRIAQLDPDARRRLLLRVMDVKATPADIRARAAARGCTPALLDALLPVLRSGFEAAHQEALTRATEAKGAWQALTGERWGPEKATHWRAPTPEGTDSRASAAARLAETAARVETARGAHAEAHQALGAARGPVREAGGLAGLEARARDREALAEALAAREAERARAQARHQALLAAEPRHGGLLSRFECPACGASTRVLVSQGQVQAVPEDLRDPMVSRQDVAAAAGEAAAAEAACAAARSALAAAEAAAELVAKLAGAVRPEALAALEARAGDTARALAEADRAQEAARASVRAWEDAARRSSEAAATHAQIRDWLALAEAFAPAGIPGELLAEALGPFNARLRVSAERTGWAQVHLGEDMAVTAAGRTYGLLSESERWRADAALGDALAHLSGVRLLALDRIDVLDLAERQVLVRWALTLADEHDTVLLAGTLKAPPRLPAAIDVDWIERGRLGAPAEEAA